MTTDTIEITCPACKSSFKRTLLREQKHPLRFCAYCGATLKAEEVRALPSIFRLHRELPEKTQILFSIGPYQILKTIAKGGMGEVFLAYDTVSGRKIALKRIRDDLLLHPQINQRFLREARLTSQLIHPTIIPIYSIHESTNLTYYTMPYLEGETLRQIFRKARERERQPELPKDPHTSIPALIRIFLQVCQAVAYAHSHGVLHRDLKPENFIVGKYGEVLILDWGLAKMVNEESDDEDIKDAEISVQPHVTKIGKVVGTIAYMAPERALGKPATIQTDIYSLGVVLYQILTLELPFHRKNIDHFKKIWMKEVVEAPELVAPYRDVPEILSEVVKKCLAKESEERYNSVAELIQSLENYLEGRSEWFPAATLDIDKKSDWQFQEHILIAEHTAITRSLDASDWMTLMISKASFPENARLEAEVKIGKKGHGLGFLFSSPDALHAAHMSDGWCLWLAAEGDTKQKTKLLRSSISVVEAPNIQLPVDEWQKIVIEKIDRHFYFYINGLLQFSYTSHVPVIGSHIGLLAKDANFDLRNFTVSIGSQHLTVGCLAIPDAFLAHSEYDRALTEYRRIGNAFPGRQEGREAIFRAGITLLEKAKTVQDGALYSAAYSEFEKLRLTPGAPIEYLGKALVYQAEKQYSEEVKCLELALRRYPKHPLLSIITEQVIFRMHEASRENRKAAFEFISLGARFLPKLIESTQHKQLIQSLKTHWEVPFFIEHLQKPLDADLEMKSLELILSFWLAKSTLLEELVLELLQRPILPIPLISDAIFCMAELGDTAAAIRTIQHIRTILSQAEQKRLLSCFEPLEAMLQDPEKALTFDSDRALYFVVRQTIQEGNFDFLRKAIPVLQMRPHPEMRALLLEISLLLDEKSVLNEFESEKLDEKSPLYLPLLALLAKKEGVSAAMNRLTRQLPEPYPRSHLLGAACLASHIDYDTGAWKEGSFFWEQKRLFQQLFLFATAMGDREKQALSLLRLANLECHGSE